MNELDKERKMFGETIAEMERMKPVFYSNGLYAMAILSDVQELLTNNVMNYEQRETCRQWINKAKFFIAQEDHKEIKL